MNSEEDFKFYEELCKYIERHTSINEGKWYTFQVSVKRDGDNLSFADTKLLEEEN